MSGCGNPGHDTIVAFAWSTALFPPARGVSVQLQFRDDGCITWKKQALTEEQP